MPKRNFIYILAIALAVVVTLWVNRSGDISGPHLGPVSPTEQARRLIERHYYRSLEGRQLDRQAIEAMVASLDQWSVYVGPEFAPQMRQHILGGRDWGLGLCIEENDGAFDIVGPLPGSPAHQKAIHNGRLLAVDGVELAGMELSEVKGLLRPEPLTEVVLTIRPPRGQPRQVTLTSSQYSIETVQGLFRGDDGRWIHTVDAANRTGYIRITEFVEDTPSHVGQALRRMPDIRSLVLDLRGNPGGLLTAAVECCNLLLDEGVIVRMVGRDGPGEQYVAQASSAWPDLAVVVLVDERTASAAEIVAGSLRFHHRAVVIGQRTAGKGCSQSMFELGGGLGQLYLTTSEYLIGGVQSINRQAESTQWGVEPHQRVELTPERSARLARLLMRGGVMKPDRSEAPASLPPTAPADDEISVAQFLSLDLQLARAVGLLAEPSDVGRLLRQARQERINTDTQTPGARP